MSTTTHSPNSNHSVSTDDTARAEPTTADQAKEQLQVLKEDLSELGSLAKATADETVDSVRERSGEYLERGRGKTSQYGDSLRNHVNERPIRSLAIAAGVGLLLGALGRR